MSGTPIFKDNSLPAAFSKPREPHLIKVKDAFMPSSKLYSKLKAIQATFPLWAINSNTQIAYVD